MPILTMISAGLAWGGLLALLHFGGLWLSLRFMPAVARPTLWFWGGFLVRYGVTLAGMGLTIKIGPPAVMAACAGFYLMRMIAVPRLAGIRGLPWR